MSKEPIEDVLVILQDSESYSQIEITDSTGSCYFQIPDTGVYVMTLLKDEIFFEYLIVISSEDSTFTHVL